MYDICFFLSDLVRSITGSRFIHLTMADSNLFFLWLNTSPFYIGITSYLGCFHVLATVDSAAVNIGVHVSF